MDVSSGFLESLPLVSPSDDPLNPFDTDNLCVPLFEDEIITAISQLKSGKAPGLDGITAKMIMLGGVESVRWFNTLFDTSSLTFRDFGITSISVPVGTNGLGTFSSCITPSSLRFVGMQTAEEKMCVCVCVCVCLCTCIPIYM